MYFAYFCPHMDKTHLQITDRDQVNFFIRGETQFCFRIYIHRMQLLNSSCFLLFAFCSPQHVGTYSYFHEFTSSYKPWSRLTLYSVTVNTIFGNLLRPTVPLPRESRFVFLQWWRWYLLRMGIISFEDDCLVTLIAPRLESGAHKFNSSFLSGRW